MDSQQQPQDLAPGTRLATRRHGYVHHGIYVGAGRVIHYAGLFRQLHGVVEEVSLERFSKGHSVCEVQTERRSFDGEEIVRRARSRLGERGYSVLSNNCEHFCSWCLSGEPRSEQIDRWLALPRRCGAVLAQAFGFCSAFRSARTVAECSLASTCG